ncbi:hypothetical protein [Sulfuriroseicoccus oceanibius]|uniref:Uncharacterized protein n=1 Tax=Sulfuriroseicoccus oceanibius TaxID=2707525 RepID=A0A6B3L988_9BACT|nr:hypothetical protein [Sulfuriroseicoccus oceanibius]QQL45421.1 hypothetical protein G3M56_002180 [Sulfuriroseicoccus oceanibius]
MTNQGVEARMVVDEYAGRKEYVTLSDQDGRFELLGKKGARVRVKVSLSGYAPTTDDRIGTNVSARTIYYAPESKPAPAYAPPTKDHPQVFVLRKRSPGANLGYAESSRVRIKRSGEAKEIALDVEGKRLGIDVRCWSAAPVPFSHDKYDWRAEIRVVEGKLQPITEDEPITSPTEGYLPVFCIELPKDTEANWLRSSPRGTRDFWVKFNDGTYAKAEIVVRTGRKHEVDVELWYNLDGDNNFESE